MIFVSMALQSRHSPYPNSPEMRLLAHGPAVYGRGPNVVSLSDRLRMGRRLAGSKGRGRVLERRAHRLNADDLFGTGFFKKTRTDSVLESSIGWSCQPLPPCFRRLPECGQTNGSLA